MGSNGNDGILAEIYEAAGRYILEGGREPRFVGDDEQVRAITWATAASRRLYEALNDPGSSLDLVVELGAERQRAASNFERVVGSPWRL